MNKKEYVDNWIARISCDCDESNWNKKIGITTTTRLTAAVELSKKRVIWENIVDHIWTWPDKDYALELYYEVCCDAEKGFNPNERIENYRAIEDALAMLSDALGKFDSKSPSSNGDKPAFEFNNFYLKLCSDFVGSKELENLSSEESSVVTEGIMDAARDLPVLIDRVQFGLETIRLKPKRPFAI